MKKGSSDFKSAIKQRLVPDFVSGGTVPSAGSQQRQQPAQPKDELSNQTGPLKMIDTLATGGTQSVEDIANDYWFSALQPIKPVAPASYRPRQRQFLPGENLIWTPGEDKGGVTFDQLRAFADGWDLLRVVIETRKDQLCRMKWQIRPKAKPGQTQKETKEQAAKDKTLAQLRNFFLSPDGIHTWSQWIRMLFEDTLVLDATAIYYQRDKQGRIASCPPIDGGTITRLLTDMGTVPQPPSAAYQQVVYGTPACDLTTKDLLYMMRNERTHRRYGYSPVEQIIVTISMGLRREDFQLKYYTDGNIPEALCFLPSNIPVGRIREIQDWFDSVLAGDLSKRRRLTFLPGYGNGGREGVTPNVIFPKEALLKDEMDDWLMRIVCYAFSVSPQNLMKQMNRASAEQASTVADEEGLEPAMSFVDDFANRIIRDMGLDDSYEFAWQEERDTDPVKQAQIDSLLVGKLYTINETREARGDDPRPEPEADMLGIFGPTGFIPIDQQPQQFEQQQEMQQRNQDLQEQTFQAQQEQDSQSSQQKITKLKRVQKVEPGQYTHPVYGDLSKQDRFFAYDTASDQVLVKGDVDIDSACRLLKQYYPELVVEWDLDHAFDSR